MSGRWEELLALWEETKNARFLASALRTEKLESFSNMEKTFHRLISDMTLCVNFHRGRAMLASFSQTD